ncbi:MAG: PAS domain S-box protein, partial [Thermodesulfobacteriota bacterium]
KADGSVVWIKCVSHATQDEDGDEIKRRGVWLDISKQKGVEEELLFFRNLIDEGNDAIFLIDAETGNIIEVNQRASISLGYLRSELCEMKVADIEAIIPDDFSWKKHVEEVRELGFMVLEGTHKRKDATTFPAEVNVRIVPYKDKDYLVAIVRDISDRREVEDQLRKLHEELEARVAVGSEELEESRRSIATLFSNLPGMAYRCRNDKGWIAELVSEGSYELTGYRREDFLSGDRIIYTTLIDPEDKDYVLNEIQNAVDKKEPYQLLYRIDSKEGKKKWVWEQGCGVFDDDGELIALEGFASDITERKLAEDKLMLYKEVIIHSNDAIVIRTPNGVFLEQNTASKALMGYSDEELEGTTPALMIGEETFEVVKAKLKKFGTSLGDEVITRKDGTKVDVEVSAFTVKDDTGEPAQIVGIIRDITERKEREEEHIKAGRLESIAILAGGIAHDFNNILTGIMANVGMSIMLVEDGSQVSRKLKEAEKACEKAKALTQQLLTFSTGGEPVKEIVLLADLIRDSANMVLAGSNVNCTYSIPAELLPVEVDAGQMSQVINNLILNAIHAMSEGGTIHVDAENVDLGSDDDLPLAEGRYVKLSIADEGKGISNEYLSKVFDPYFTTKEDGTGLGLATVYSIVKKHDGHVFLQSELGVGTTIHIYLPASSGMVEVSRTKEVVKKLDGKGRVLVMDDDKIVREVACEVLKNAGFEVDGADDGKEAIKLYKEAIGSGVPYDLLIMDLTVPGGMGGKEAMAGLLKIDPNVKAIVSSGYSNDPVMADHRKFGFIGMLAKPYAIKELQGMVLDLIHSKLK